MTAVNADYVRDLIDFAPTAKLRAQGFAERQLEGAVALYNLLAQNKFAYLADEVGTGKTYVALGVMALFRHFQPESRIMVLAPRENIQRKWVKEYENFVAGNWKVLDNRVKSIRGTPARTYRHVHSLHDMARLLTESTHWDLFLRITSFSLALRGAGGQRRARSRLSHALPRIRNEQLPARDGETAYRQFRDRYGVLLNSLMPPIDLLIVDEAHNFKHGWASQAARNRLAGLVFGRPLSGDDAAGLESAPEYGHRVRHLLLLSATPFEHEYRQIYNQLDLFGFGGANVQCDGTSVPLKALADRQTEPERQKRIVQQFLIRRVLDLKIAGEAHTKNMYRREWRRGGLATHDAPVEINDPKQRLMVALMQKKIAEILASDKFNNHFQIGMLSSFESFVESATKGRLRLREEAAEQAEAEEQAGAEAEAEAEADEGGDGDDDDVRTFDDAQDALADEKHGIDSASLGHIVRSYRTEVEDAPLPHPKLDATVRALASTFQTGDKALVFVRRLATMGELGARLNRIYDEQLRAQLKHRLPTLAADIDGLFERYRTEAMNGEVADNKDLDLPAHGDQLHREPEDTGGTDSFFDWFFRGDGPSGVLSGAAFRKNRFINPSSAYSTLFEDNYVSRLLGRPSDTWVAFAQAANVPLTALEPRLRQLAFQRFAAQTKRRDAFPRLHLLEAYQGAALELLREGGGDISHSASLYLEYCLEAGEHRERVPDGFPGPQDVLNTETFITKLASHPLRQFLWPESGHADARHALLELEQRRELLGAMCRLGASYIDLYAGAIEQIGTFHLGGQASGDDGAEHLANAFLKTLSDQASTPGFHAFRELSEAASAFDTIIATNFPEVRGEKIPRLRTIYARTLQAQSPVATTSTRKVHRLVRQFRMPGYPLVLVSTDILQEGEDLHTFCRNVVHYGITWTPSAMEQRTGRVDRIGSLTQRRLDGRESPVTPEEKIQVYFPHLRDTVEVLQVRKVLRRLNQFLTKMHDIAPAGVQGDSRVDALREMIADHDDVPAITDRLESAFPVQPEWLEGSGAGNNVHHVPVDRYLSHWHSTWAHVATTLRLEDATEHEDFHGHGSMPLAHDNVPEAHASAGGPSQPITLEVRAEDAGNELLLRCSSPISPIDLSKPPAALLLAELQVGCGLVKVVATADTNRRQHNIAVVREMLFHPETTQFGEAAHLASSTAKAAAAIAEALQNESAEPSPSGANSEGNTLHKLIEQADELIQQEDLPFRLERQGHKLTAHLKSGRHQVVRLSMRGDEYRLISTVVGPRHVPDNASKRADLLLRIWAKNGATELVSFGIDRRNRVVGVCCHPVATLDLAELRHYVIALVQECDRFEWVLSGEDRN